MLKDGMNITKPVVEIHKVIICGGRRVPFIMTDIKINRLDIMIKLYKEDEIIFLNTYLISKYEDLEILKNVALLKLPIYL